MALAKRVKQNEKKEPPRLKLMLFGKSGVGKTYGSMWPDSYILDGERGTVHYDKMLAERNCGRVMVSDVIEASKHIKELMTTKNSYKTLVVDPITAYYEDSQTKWTDLFIRAARAEGGGAKADMQDFGFRYWGKVKSEQKAFLGLLKRVDMNVICTCHEKDKYGDNMKLVGQTYDGIKGLDYVFDTVIRLVKQGDRRVAVVEKDRTGKFPDKFDYTYDRILDIWGDGMKRVTNTIVLATEAQISTLKELLGVIQVKDEWETDCFRKADVTSWEEMDTTTIQKCITFLSKKLPKQQETPKIEKPKSATKETANANAT